MRGRLLDLKRLSVHDGPGIRTTLFMKGCPLNCRWCHNPESVSPEPEIGLLKRKCAGCGKCAEICPAGAHRFHAGEHLLDHERCRACGKCVEACLRGALEYYGREISPEDAVAAVLEDRTFYAQSGGGCTISGGEPLWQPEFCAEVFALLHSEQIHCALDTSGAVPWESFEIVLPQTDLFLYDLKHVDDRLHREHTGSGNAQVLDNLKRLSEVGTPIEIRIPTVPGFNAEEGSVEAIARFLSGLPNIISVRLLPYHLARSKYETMGRAYPMAEVAPPEAEAMEGLAEILREHGLKIV
ncbi:MAG: glycyl-radical enzyme activating protein [Armatimonadota bacterium]